MPAGGQHLSLNAGADNQNARLRTWLSPRLSTALSELTVI